MSGTHGAGSPTGGSRTRSVEQRLAERYGRTQGPALGQRAALVAIAILAAAAVAWWIWVAVVRSDPPVTWQLIGYANETESSVEVRWTVHRDPQAQVECILRARDGSGAEVGRDRVAVPPGDLDSVEVRATVKTSGRPVTGEVLSCLPVGG